MKPQVTISRSAVGIIAPAWTREEIRRVVKFFERKQDFKILGRFLVEIKKQRRGYGSFMDCASIPAHALSPQNAKLYGVWYIIHELLHVAGWTHGIRMRKRESELMEMCK